MERLTNKREADAQRKEYERRLENGYPRNIPEERFLRLAAYEDTGMTPEEVEHIKLALMGKSIAEIKEFNGLPIDRLRELAEADKDGRVAVLPCKVGDKLYRVFDGNISEHEVQNMKYFARQGRLGIDMTPFFPDAEKFIGKTVFLTRNEAEEALRRAENCTF